MKIMTKSTEIISEDFLKQGHIWVAPVWSYTDNKFKPRPVVIVGNDEANDQLDVLINFVTKTPGRNKYDVEIKYWREAGLNCPSWVRTSKPLTIQKSSLRTEIVERNGVQQPRGYIGKLHDEDLANVIEMCKNIY
jgi:mRNA interferase MazF